MDRPRELGLTLGEDLPEFGKKFERVAKDIETAFSFINQTTGSADDTNAGSIKT